MKKQITAPIQTVQAIIEPPKKKEVAEVVVNKPTYLGNKSKTKTKK